jgi:hypothetical protein
MVSRQIVTSKAANFQLAACSPASALPRLYYFHVKARSTLRRVGGIFRSGLGATEHFPGSSRAGFADWCSPPQSRL